MRLRALRRSFCGRQPCFNRFEQFVCHDGLADVPSILAAGQPSVSGPAGPAAGAARQRRGAAPPLPAEPLCTTAACTAGSLGCKQLASRPPRGQIGGQITRAPAPPPLPLQQLAECRRRSRPQRAERGGSLASGRPRRAAPVRARQRRDAFRPAGEGARFRRALPWDPAGAVFGPLGEPLRRRPRAPRFSGADAHPPVGGREHHRAQHRPRRGRSGRDPGPGEPVPASPLGARQRSRPRRPATRRPRSRQDARTAQGIYGADAEVRLEEDEGGVNVSLTLPLAPAP
jgi:hypothetical protein